MFKDKTLLITGGTGSFGNAVLRRFLNSEIKEIRIFSRDEKKQDDLRNEYKNPKIKFYVGDVREYSSIAAAMGGVDYVFHAAALKQVPSCEFFPLEAVRTNVLGTENVLNAAIANQVKKVICLSTDKAVYPINAMGMSKAMMEKLAVSKARMGANHDTIISVTRYGNVMASRGSVIPLFIKQLKTGQSLTITDPNMTRFMMSLDDAIDLVLFAFENAKGGELFIQKAPAATIEVLAEAMREVFDINADITCIGTRHGEKLYETLLTREEKVKSYDLGRYFMVSMDDRDLNYGKFFVDGEKIITEGEDYNSHNTEMLDRDQMVEMLKKLDYIQSELKNNAYGEGY
ncbi:polysaccharide biosynthesis protein [Paenibacillus roseipurpureus]|uniref:UDP-glucose 4-epimerase n=1 Tax=Paenibacillus roseopurpureus TaxID=2918901 RepID=A0AA96LMQ9_9BACL|nr:polysaccharide biosynthesis protein [Paenibacillus sp. MBLB1832]WNR43883.1 polysaccharide biosynthesis protein [Paenibacillus sp. MBLB1832]